MNRPLLTWRQFGTFSHAVTLALCLVVIACAPARTSQSGGTAETGAPPSAPKRLITAIMVEPSTLYRPLIPGTYVIQTAALGDTSLSIGLTTNSPQGVLVPRVAEAVPSVENGQWRLLADGQMELVWKIRSGATWHDGAPFTPDDLVFTIQTSLDPNLPELR